MAVSTVSKVSWLGCGAGQGRNAHREAGDESLPERWAKEQGSALKAGAIGAAPGQGRSRNIDNAGTELPAAAFLLVDRLLLRAYASLAFEQALFQKLGP
jgi:hypothetical protein